MALITNSNVIKLNYIPVDVDRPNDLVRGFIYFDANTGEILINDGVDTRVFGFNQSVLDNYVHKIQQGQNIQVYAVGHTQGDFEGIDSLEVSSSLLANSLIQRDGNNRANIEDPLYDKHIANKGYVDSEIDNAISRVYKPSGSLTNTVVEATTGNDKAADYLIADNVGNVYNVTNGSFTTHSNLFKEGNGKTYPLGTNIVVIKDGASYLFDVLAGFVDLSDYLTIDSTLSAAKLNGTIPADVKAVTQNATDNTAKIATTAFVKSQGYTTNTGTVTSVGLSLPNIFTVSGGPVTASGSLTASLASQTKGYVFAGPKDNNGTPTFRKLSYTELDDQPTIPQGTVTSVTGTSPIISSGETTPVISLADSYGDTKNPYGSKTAKYFLAAPNNANGAPTFRAIMPSDIPTLNQNTTGSAAKLTNSIAFKIGSKSQDFDGSKAITYNLDDIFNFTEEGIMRRTGDNLYDIDSTVYATKTYVDESILWTVLS